MQQTRVRRPRIADVAEAAGVSKAAVSFAFNNPERLKPETADRIRVVASELGYRPHPVARMLSAQRTMTIGVLTPQPLSQVFANPFFAYFAEGVSSVTEEHGFGLLLISPLRGSLTRALDRATVDGVVALGLDENHPEIEAIRRASVPMVLVDAPGWVEHSSVQVDDEAGARAAAEHVVGLGHRDVLIIAVEGPVANPSPDEGPNGGQEIGESVTARRLRGYLSALEPAGLEVGPGSIVVAPATFEGGEAAFLRAWEDGFRPTAVLAMSDALAIGALQASRHLRLRVPRDLSVVGFDDLPIGRFSDPPLTTVHQPVRRKGEEAARLLLDGLGARAGSPAQHRMLKTRLVVRRSTGAPPAGAGREEVGLGE
ncbi:MAG: LacI family DNA-binding transcriptional regulator [Chloroflexi bacterium]|nr:LacI family DNA-binding transcriptional regulator [Chloroflexota bacterium]